jgi:peroxiredoxin
MATSKISSKIKVFIIICLATVLMAACSTQSKVDNSSVAAGSALSESQSEGLSDVSESDEDIAHEAELAPSFSLETLDGEVVTLKDYEGSYVILNFWATWCQYCDQEMPDLMAFQAKYKDEVTVLSINVKEDAKTVQAYVDKKKLNLPVLLDKDGQIAKEYQVGAYPTSFLIDRAGKIIGYLPVMMSAKDMEVSFKYLKDHDTVK